MHLKVSRLQLSDPLSWSKFRIRFFHICVYLFVGGRSLIVRGVEQCFGMIRHRNKGVKAFGKHKRTSNNGTTKSRRLFEVPGFLMSDLLLSKILLIPKYTFSNNQVRPPIRYPSFDG